MIVSGCTICGAQEVSTEVIASEEELLDALSSGEIDYDTYLLLLDLILNGADSAHIDLLDLLPSSVETHNDQMTDFVKASTFGRARKTFAKYQFGGELEDSGRTKYRLSGRYNFDSNWSAEIGIAGEYTGRERFTRRSIRYTTSKSRPVASVTLGNYRARFGLGTVIGYRGKLVDYSGKLEGESILFPDYGGFNGGMVELNRKYMKAVALGSIQRDATHSVSTFAANAMTTTIASEAGVIVAGNMVRDRISSANTEVYQIGAFLRQDIRSGSLAAEYSLQEGEAEAGALVVEAKKKWSVVSVALSGWSYAKDYYGLSAGSKAASLSRTTEIEDVHFTFSDKRSGQTGGRMQASVCAHDNVSLSGDLLYAHRGEDTSTLQGLVGVTGRISRRHRFTTDFLYKSTEKSGSGENSKRRGRVEWRGDWSTIRTRASVGFANETSYDEYWSLLVQCYLGKEGSERWQVWSNWRRVAHGRIEAWHGFVSITEDLARGVRGSVKFTDSYSHTSTPHHSPTIGLELQVQL